MPAAPNPEARWGWQGFFKMLPSRSTAYQTGLSNMSRDGPGQRVINPFPLFLFGMVQRVSHDFTRVAGSGLKGPAEVRGSVGIPDAHRCLWDVPPSPRTS